MKYTLILGALLSIGLTTFSTKAAEINKADLKVNKILYKKLFTNFNQGIHLAAVKYNKKLNDTKHIEKIFKRAQLVPKNQKIPKNLPAAKVVNNKLIIPKLSIEYSFENFLDNTLSLNNKAIESNCKIKSECIFNLIKKLAPKKTTSVFDTFFFAYANEINLMNHLDVDDYKLMTAIMTMDNEFQDIPTLSGFGLASDDEKLNVVKENLKKVFPRILQVKSDCESWKSNKDIYSFNRHNNMFNSIKQIMELAEDNEFISASEDKLGEEVFSFTNTPNKSSFYNNKRDWNKVLTCKDTLGIKKILDSTGDQIESKFKDGPKALKGSIGLNVHSSLKNIPTDAQIIKEEYQKEMANILKETNNLSSSFFLDKYGSYSKIGNQNSSIAKKINSLLKQIRNSGKYSDEAKELHLVYKAALPPSMMKQANASASQTDMSAFMDEHKKLHTQHQVLSKIFDKNKLTSKGYCESISKLKACLSEYYEEAKVAYNEDRLSGDDKDSLEDLVDLDPKTDISGDKVTTE